MVSLPHFLLKKKEVLNGLIGDSQKLKKERLARLIRC